MSDVFFRNNVNVDNVCKIRWLEVWVGANMMQSAIINLLDPVDPQDAVNLRTLQAHAQVVISATAPSPRAQQLLWVDTSS